MRRWFLALLLVAFLLLVVAAAAAAAPLPPPWDGNPISHGIGPSYGETWPVPVPTDEAVYNLQGAPHDTSTLAVMPYADVGPLLAQFQTEASCANLPQRMTYRVSGQSAGGRDMYVVVVNDLETANQRRDYARWQHIRDDRAHQSRGRPGAPRHLRQRRQDAHLRRGRHQRQRVRGHRRDDAGPPRPHRPRRSARTPPSTRSSTTRSSSSCRRPTPTVASWASAATPPGGRHQPRLLRPVAARGADRRRHPAAVAGHRRAAPARLRDADARRRRHDAPQPGHRRHRVLHVELQAVTQATKADFTAAGLGIQSPVLDWNASGNIPTTYTIAAAPGGATESGTTVTITTTASNSSQISVGYTVIIAGVTEAGYNGTFVVTGKPSTTTFTYTAATLRPPGLRRRHGGQPRRTVLRADLGRLGPLLRPDLHVVPRRGQLHRSRWTTPRRRRPDDRQDGQYLNFYSSANFWLDNRQAMMSDQLKMFLAGVNNAPTDPNAFAASSYLTGLGFTDYSNNWMVQYPKAYVIPWGNGQRSDAEANRIAQWCLDNGIQVQRMTSDFTWNGHTFQAGSYVVSMSQALRGLAWNAFAAGTDIESKISHPLRVAGRLEPRAPLGRRHGRDPARRCLVQPKRPAHLRRPTAWLAASAAASTRRPTSTPSRSRACTRTRPSWACSPTASTATSPRRRSPAPPAAPCRPAP